MRYLFLGLIFASTAAIADSAVGHYDPVLFEMRFHKADKGNKGKLSRQEAYAEFPLMPQYFDEIDSNKDHFITLEEVNRAVERRVDKAMAASAALKYHHDRNDARPGAPKEAVPAELDLHFSGEAEARRYYRSQYYESMASDYARARGQGETVPQAPASPLLHKQF